MVVCTALVFFSTLSFFVKRKDIIVREGPSFSPLSTFFFSFLLFCINKPRSSPLARLHPNCISRFLFFIYFFFFSSQHDISQSTSLCNCKIRSPRKGGGKVGSVAGREGGVVYIIIITCR